MPYKYFEPNILTAGDVNQYLMNQSVMVFDNATARDAALTAPTEGMIVYLKDTNNLMVYTGTAWGGVGMTQLSVGTSSGAQAQLSSTAGDNWNIRTFTNSPNPNFSLGVRNGSGADSHVGLGWESQVLKLRGSGTTTAGIEINSANYVRMPTQPTFVVSGGTSTQGPGFYKVVFATVHYNDGSGYNASTGRFTCPANAAGWYFFSAQARLDSAGGGYIRGAIAKNGTLIYNPPNLHSINGNFHSTNYHSITVAGVMFMLGGDYVEYWTGSDSTTSNVQGESTFTGRYLG